MVVFSVVGINLHLFIYFSPFVCWAEIFCLKVLSFLVPSFGMPHHFGFWNSKVNVYLEPDKSKFNKSISHFMSAINYLFGIKRKIQALDFLLF